MSIIDSQRPASLSRGLKKLFSGSHSQIGGTRKHQQSSTSVAHAPLTMPGLGHELSLPMIGLFDGKRGRHLRIFCESVCSSAKFKTVFISTDDKVQDCIQKVMAQASSTACSTSHSGCILVEVVGNLPSKSQAFGNTDEISDPAVEFNECSSRELKPSDNMLHVFAYMVPAPGLYRRLELRKQTRTPSVPPRTLNSPLTERRTPIRSNSSCNSSRRSPRMLKAPMVAPFCPYILLVKGSRPEKDMLLHNFSGILRSNKNILTMGTAESDDIRLYLSPDSRNVHQSAENGAVDTAPIRLMALMDEASKKKEIWLQVASGYNAIQPKYPLSVTLNLDNLTSHASLPTSKCLEPGDILRVEGHHLHYVFIFKDSETVPEHKLSLGLLSLPQMPVIEGRPPSGQNGKRSASRTARIDALVRKNSVQSSSQSPDTTGAAEGLPSVNCVELLVRLLFPKTVSRRREWGEKGGTLPDVGVASGCFAHLVRSIVRHGVEWGGTTYAAHAATDDELLREVLAVFKRELEGLSRLASQHLMLAIWEAAFCYYLSQYLSPGWLANPPAKQPRIRVLERRRSRGKSNDYDASTPSEVFNSPATSKRNVGAALAVDSGGLHHHHQQQQQCNGDEDFKGELEHLPVLSALREKAYTEADAAMNEAVEQSLGATSKDVCKLCRLFGNSSSSVQEIQTIQTALFEKLESTGTSLSLALARWGTTVASTVTTPEDEIRRDPIRLSQAVPYEGVIDYDEMDDEIESGQGSISHEGDVLSSSSPSNRTSSLNDDADTGIDGSSIITTSNGTAQHRVKTVFYCKFLMGMSKRIIDTFIKDPTLVNWATGIQLQNLVKAFSKWMQNAGVQQYKDMQGLLYDFAHLMAIPRQKIVTMKWSQLRRERPDLPEALLYFILNNYDGGRAKWEAPDWNELPSSYLEPMEAVDHYLRQWQELEHLKSAQVGQKAVAPSRPLDLATLFRSSRSKDVINKMDMSLADQNQTFRWADLLNTYSPPGAVQTYKVASKIPTVTIAQNTGSISSSNYSCQRGSSDSNDFRDFADLHDEVKKQRPNTLAFPDPPVPIVRPTISSEGPSRSATAGRAYNYRRATASELGFSNRTGLQKISPVPGGGFRARTGTSELGSMNPQRPDMSTSTLTFSRQPNYTKNPTNPLRGSGFSVSNLLVSRSTDFNSARDIQKIRDDWSDFMQTLSRPTTPSTIEPDARSLVDTMHDSYSTSIPAMLSQSHYQFSTIADRPRIGSTLDMGDWNVRKSQSSLIGIDMEQPPIQAIINVQLKKVTTETYGITLIEGHLTRFGQLGVYVKAVSPDSPAAKNNIATGDRILAIDGVDLTGTTFNEACNLLKKSTNRVTLTIQRGLVGNPDDLLYT